MMLKRFALLLFALWTGCARVPDVSPSGSIQKPMNFDHSRWAKVLQTVVDENGLVDYARLQKHPAVLNAYLQTLAQNDPDRLPEQERLAYWINAYNAYTLKLIIENYPVRSILRITPLPISGFSSAWDLTSVTIGGKKYTLAQLEHDIIRQEFKEPRIHFALVCAAQSCPKLRREPYSGMQLDEQLQEQAVDFLTDQRKNQLASDQGTIALSRIFEWFKADFEQNGQSVQAYLAQFFPYEDALRTKLSRNEFRVRYVPYHWGLNQR